MNTHPLVARASAAYALLIRVASCLKCPFLLAIRLFWGVALVQTGWGKLHHLGDVTDFFTQLHVPLPGLNALLASTTEFVGGILLIGGLASRLISVPLTVLLCVAYLTADPEALRDADKFVKADEFPFLFTVLVVLIFGPGAISLDHFIGKKFGPPASKPATPSA